MGVTGFAGIDMKNFRIPYLGYSKSLTSGVGLPIKGYKSFSTLFRASSSYHNLLIFNKINHILASLYVKYFVYLHNNFAYDKLYLPTSAQI